jgi:hypothetical protein
LNLFSGLRGPTKVRLTNPEPEQEMAMSPRTQKIIIGVFFGMCALIGGLYLIQLFSPDEDYRQTIDTLNTHGEMLEKGGHVEKIEFVTSRKRMLEILEKFENVPQRRKERLQRRIEERGDEMDEDRDRMFYGEVLDPYGKPIGEVAAFRVEGFGIARPHYEWYGESGSDKK